MAKSLKSGNSGPIMTNGKIIRIKAMVTNKKLNLITTNKQILIHIHVYDKSVVSIKIFGPVLIICQLTHLHHPCFCKVHHFRNWGNWLFSISDDTHNSHRRDDYRVRRSC